METTITTPNRRDFLKTVGGTSIVATAGCLGSVTGGGTIKFGGVLPLSGPAADAGVWVERAWEVWHERVNEAGGVLDREAELLIYDHESDAGTMQSQTSRLIEEDNVDIFLGPYLSVTFPVVTSIVQRHNMVAIAHFPTADHMDEKEQNPDYQDHIFGLSVGFREWPIDFVHNVLGGLPADQQPERVAIASGQDAFGRSMATHGSQALEDLGIEVVANEFYERDTTDLSPLVRSIQGEDPDGLMVGSYPGDAILMSNAVAEVGLDLDFIYQFVGPQFPAFVGALEDRAEFQMGSTIWHPDLPVDSAQEIADTAVEQFDAEPPYTYGMGYTQCQLSAQAVENVGEVDQDAIRDELKTGEFNTVLSDEPVTFGEFNILSSPIYTTQIIDGSIEIVYPDAQASADLQYPLPGDWP